MKAQQKKLSVCASNSLAHEDLGHFEEAHHWNIQAKFYNEKFPLVNKSDNIGDYDSPTSRDETPDDFFYKRGQRSPNKKEAIKKERKGPNKQKYERKERRDNCYYLFPHLCFKVAPCSS